MYERAREDRAYGRRYSNSHAARRRIAKRHQLIAGSSNRPNGDLGVRCEQPAGIGQNHTPTRSKEQLRVQFLFERLDLTA